MHYSMGISEGKSITVKANDETYAFNLNTNGLYKVKGAFGYTEIEIKDRKVRITKSPCKNKICIRQGFANTLVCLPNKVIVTVENTGDFDAVAK